ncbi:MAG: HNH endonuclease, partial [Thermoanaerobaculaceae bacterium]|nr:HNH endonuclease [Thermoanaerobaculaceae bacterium]
LQDLAGHPIHAPPDPIAYDRRGEGDIIWSQLEDAPILTASQVGNERFLHGRPLIASLGLYDHRARFYDPTTQTFLEPDPLGPVDSPNLYQAFGLDPQNNTDPLGLCGWWSDTPCREELAQAAEKVKGAVAGWFERNKQQAERIVEQHKQVAQKSGAELKRVYGALGQAVHDQIAHDATLVGSLPSPEWKDANRTIGETVITGLTYYVAWEVSRGRGDTFRAPNTPRIETLDTAPGAGTVTGGSTYAERLAQTPVRGGWWSGQRGESVFYTYDSQANTKLSGQGIVYSNARPDLSSAAIEQVKITGMTVDRGVNFALADEALAQKLAVSPREIEMWRMENSFTWHEVEDLTTMQLVPSRVNSPAFKHLGGVGEIKRGARVVQ